MDAQPRFARSPSSARRETRGNTRGRGVVWRGRDGRGVRGGERADGVRRLVDERAARASSARPPAPAWIADERHRRSRGRARTRPSPKPDGAREDGRRAVFRAGAFRSMGIRTMRFARAAMPARRRSPSTTDPASVYAEAETDPEGRDVHRVERAIAGEHGREVGVDELGDGVRGGARAR